MATGLALSVVLQQLLKEFKPDIPEEEEEEVESEIQSKLRSVLGHNWATLPLTGPRMMLMVLVMNYTLLPKGVTPITIADEALEKAREYGVEQRFTYLLTTAKERATSTGEFTSEKMQELSEYAEDKGINRQNMAELIGKMQDGVKSGLSSASSFLKSGLNRGKNAVGGLVNNKPDEDQTDQTDEELSQG